MAQDGGFETDIRFFGALTGAAKIQVMAHFDAFIHSSRWEGLPMACMEAASLGKPLLVSRETNLAEDVERNQAGLVMHETSATGVARVLESMLLLHDGCKLQQLGANARAMVEMNFSWEQNARNFVASIAAAGTTAQ